MDWAKLVADFIGQVAWPIVVLILGLRFRKPLVKLLTANGPLKSINAGPVSAEWAVEAGLAMAKDALHAVPSMEDDGAPAERTATNMDEARHESPATEPVTEPVMEESKPFLIQRLPPAVVRFAHDSPVASILHSAETLKQDLMECLLQVNPDRDLFNEDNLGKILYRAYGTGLLTIDETMAGMELARVRDRLANTTRSVHVDADTALEYERLSKRLSLAAVNAVKRDPKRQDMMKLLERVLAEK